jgi:NAD(P)-dependent dehydrogenase (short-subunit alcohol dehydrogenase family)
MDREFVAVVTGGSSGIGASLCRALLDRGYRVISVARRDAGIRHERMISILADLADAGQAELAAREIAEQHAVTHFVHNAGAFLPGAVEQVRVDDLISLTQLHAGAALIFTQAFLPAMKAARFGRILFTSSHAALGAPGLSAHAYSKAGLNGMARTWALELGPYGITVNVVAPGPVAPDGFGGIGAAEGAGVPAETLPLRRIGTYEDVVAAMLFFADPGNGFVTGQILHVSGGASL